MLFEHRYTNMLHLSGEMALWARECPRSQSVLNATQKYHKSSRNGVHSNTDIAWGIIRALPWIYKGDCHSPCPGGATKGKRNMQILIITYWGWAREGTPCLGAQSNQPCLGSQARFEEASDFWKGSWKRNSSLRREMAGGTPGRGNSICKEVTEVWKCITYSGRW